MGRVGGELGGRDGHGSGLHPISQAGKFGLIPTLISLGTGAAWLGVVSVESVGKHAPSPLRHGWAPGVGSGRGKAWGVGLGTAQPCCPQITFLCDLLLLYVEGEAHFYWRTKYEEVRCAWGLGAACLGLWPEPVCCHHPQVKAPKRTARPEQTELAPAPPRPAVQGP